jgi:membrane-associated phospholipid phosphatase
VWLFAVAVEVAFRQTLTRPPVYRHGVHLVAFDSSWPSGHALRSAIAVVALAVAWPSLRLLLGTWLVAVAVLLEVAGFHTPTDIAGGFLVATIAAVGTLEVEKSALLRSAGAPLGRARPRAGA